jgi:hypothetical protein
MLPADACMQTSRKENQLMNFPGLAVEQQLHGPLLQPLHAAVCKQQSDYSGSQLAARTLQAA